MKFQDVIDLNNLVKSHRNVLIELPPEIKQFTVDLSEARKDSKTLMPLGKNYQHTGVAGEYVVSQMLDKAMNTKIYHGKGDGGADATWRGLTVQVKSTTKQSDHSGRNPYLLFFEHQRLRADIYILVGVYGSRATVYGWIDRATLQQRWMLDTSGRYEADRYTNSTKRRILYMNQLKCSYYHDKLHRPKQASMGDYV